MSNQPVGPIRFNTEDTTNQRWIFPKMGVLMFSTTDIEGYYSFILYVNAAEIREMIATYPTEEQRDRKLNELLVLVGVDQPDFDLPRITE